MLPVNKQVSFAPEATLFKPTSALAAKTIDHLGEELVGTEEKTKHNHTISNQSETLKASIENMMVTEIINEL